MKKIITILILMFSLILSENSNAQAYDGDIDTQILFGYCRIKDASGIELQTDYGLGDVVSYGLRVNYLFIENPDVLDQYGNQIKFKGFDKVNFGLFLRLHFSETFKLSEKIDPYLGGEVSLKGMQAHAGVKYALNENFCVYGQFTNNFGAFTSLDESQGDYKVNFYDKQGIFSVGISVRL
jgi:hypothetical protein